MPEMHWHMWPAETMRENTGWRRSPSTCLRRPSLNARPLKARAASYLLAARTPSSKVDANDRGGPAGPTSMRSYFRGGGRARVNQPAHTVGEQHVNLQGFD